MELDMMTIIRNWKENLGQFGLTSIGTLANLDLKSIRTLANLDPIYNKSFANSDLVLMGSEIASGRGPNWPRSELATAVVRIRSELTKVRISQGPNWP